MENKKVNSLIKQRPTLPELKWDFLNFQGGASDKESVCQCTRCKRSSFDPWVGKIPWRRKWHSVFLPGKSHGERSLASYSPKGSQSQKGLKQLSTALQPLRHGQPRWLLPMQEMQVWTPGQDDPLKKEMATHSRILAWKILWRKEPGGL